MCYVAARLGLYIRKYTLSRRVFLFQDIYNVCIRTCEAVKLVVLCEQLYHYSGFITFQHLCIVLYACNGYSDLKST